MKWKHFFNFYFKVAKLIRSVIFTIETASLRFDRFYTSVRVRVSGHVIVCRNVIASSTSTALSRPPLTKISLRTNVLHPFRYILLTTSSLHLSALKATVSRAFCQTSVDYLDFSWASRYCRLLKRSTFSRCGLSMICGTLQVNSSGRFLSWNCEFSIKIREKSAVLEKSFEKVKISMFLQK